MSTTTEMNERDYLAAEVARARRYLAEHSDLPPVAQDAYNDFIRLTARRIEASDSEQIVYGEAADFYVAPGWAMVEALGITADTTDDELNALAAAEFQMAREQGQIVSGIFSYLHDLRDGLRERPVTRTRGETRMDSNYSKAGYYNWRVMLTDDVRSLRRTAGQQRQVCLPLDKPGWDRIYRESAEELERRGIMVWPVARVRGA